jgi:hypothetical protein
MIPGTLDPAVAAAPPGGDLYFPAAAALASPGEVGPAGGYPTNMGVTGHAGNLQVAPLAFETDATSGGQAVAHAANASKGHYTEIVNFRGSPAPWILLGLLLLTGLLVVSAEVKAKAGKARAGGEIVL